MWQIHTANSVGRPPPPENQPPKKDYSGITYREVWVSGYAICGYVFMGGVLSEGLRRGHRSAAAMVVDIFFVCGLYDVMCSTTT